MKKLLVILFTIGCSGHDINRPDEIYIDLGEQSIEFVDAVFKFEEITGIKQPKLIIGKCKNINIGCVRYDGSDGHDGIEGEICAGNVLDWSILCREPLNIDESQHHKLFIHEWSHFYLYPYLGFDGLGHSKQNNIMNYQSGGINCLGFNQVQIKEICDSYVCNNPVTDCE